MREYITEWRKQRAKEEDDLKKLKEKQAKRKVARADEERKMAERKKAEEGKKSTKLTKSVFAKYSQNVELNWNSLNWRLAIL